MRLLVFLVLFLCAVERLDAVTRGVVDDAYPHIIDLNTGVQYDWSTGRVAELVSSSCGVYVSARGVRFIPRSQHIAAPLHRDSYSCWRAADALCVSGQAHVFPSGGGKVLFMGSGPQCNGKNSGRRVTFMGASDTTLCDVTVGGHFVLISADERATIAPVGIPLYAQWVIPAMQVCLVGLIVHRAALGEGAWGGTAYAFSAVVVVSVLLFVFVAHTEKLYVTVEDSESFFFLLAYVLFHMARWLYYSVRFGPRPPCYGILVGALNLLFFRSFTTLDNPCTYLSMVFVCGRLLSKLISQVISVSDLPFIRAADVLFDALMIGVLTVYGIVPQYECLLHAWTHMLLLVCSVFVFVQIYG